MVPGISLWINSQIDRHAHHNIGLPYTGTVITFKLKDVSDFWSVLKIFTEDLQIAHSITIFVRCLETEGLQCFDAVGWVSGRASGP